MVFGNKLFSKKSLLDMYISINLPEEEEIDEKNLQQNEDKTKKIGIK